MYLIIRKIIIVWVFFVSVISSAQNEKPNNNSLEIGALAAGDEALYYGGYTKYSMPLSQNKHYLTLALSLTAYFDFEGESEPHAYLKNDIDMRLIPTINFGYSLNFKRIQLNFEVPVGLSIATTKGILINERVGFERDFYNRETFFNYGVAFSPKYKINKNNGIGLHTFYPLVSDKAQSGYQIGLGWTKSFKN